MDLSNYISDCYATFSSLQDYGEPWQLIADLEHIITLELDKLPRSEFDISGTIAVHKSANIEDGAVIKPNTFIGPNCIVKAGAYLRSGVYLVEAVSIGANCEIKQSIIFPKSSIAHLNYVGNSIIGNDVNLEAGSVLANHFNERSDKNIFVKIRGKIIDTKTIKFGSVIGDGCRIGANAVLNPGSILEKNTVVGRLEYVNQLE